jgi:hypothetical protein
MTLTIRGSGFAPASSLVIEADARWPLPDPPESVEVLAAFVASCTEMQALVSVGPNELTYYPAAVGPQDVIVVSPTEGGASGSRTPAAFEVSFLPTRADVDGNRRVDGLDLWRMFPAFASIVGEPRYDPSADLDGSGRIDGMDIVYFASWYGRAF